MFGTGREAEVERLVRDMARDFAARLRERAAQELPLLPFGGEQQAQALIDARNARCVLCCACGLSHEL